MLNFLKILILWISVTVHAHAWENGTYEFPEITSSAITMAPDKNDAWTSATVIPDISDPNGQFIQAVDNLANAALPLLVAPPNPQGQSEGIERSFNGSRMFDTLKKLLPGENVQHLGKHGNEKITYELNLKMSYARDNGSGSSSEEVTVPKPAAISHQPMTEENFPSNSSASPYYYKVLNSAKSCESFSIFLTVSLSFICFKTIF